MTERDYTPPLGSGDTADYDQAIRRWTREQRWRGAMLATLAPHSGETIIDIGCGTGTFAILLKRAEPGATVIGIDPDEEALAIAREKARLADVDIEWRRGFADAVPAGFADSAVSSLVFHQVPLAGKAAALEAIHAALRPGGRLVIADYGRQRGLMRLLFRLTIQRIDGVEDTQPNADGVLPELVRAAGFVDVQEPFRVATVTGSISLITALRA